MIDENVSAQAEGSHVPAKAGFFSRAEKAVVSDAERVIAAVEAWYAQHFHRASVEGRAPISAEDKAALVAAVAKASQAQE
jgi:hypothetical protein